MGPGGPTLAQDAQSATRDTRKSTDANQAAPGERQAAWASLRGHRATAAPPGASWKHVPAVSISSICCPGRAAPPRRAARAGHVAFVAVQMSVIRSTGTRPEYIERAERQKGQR